MLLVSMICQLGSARLVQRVVIRDTATVGCQSTTIFVSVLWRREASLEFGKHGVSEYRNCDFYSR